MLGLVCQSSPAQVSCPLPPHPPALSSFLSCAPKSVPPLSCLLCHSGVESPTHEIRADAAPSAHSAKSIIVTLAKKHTFDRPVEILLHPSGMVSHVGYCCPYGRCLVRGRVGGMWEMGGGRDQGLVPREIVSIWQSQIPSSRCHLPGRPRTRGYLRRSTVKLHNNSPSGSHLLPLQKLTKCLAQPQSIYIMYPLHKGKLRPVERKWC